MKLAHADRLGHASLLFRLRKPTGSTQHMTMSQRLVVIERHGDGHVALVKINRPDVKNALSPAALNELHAALTQLAREDEMRVVVLAGEGGTFTTGDDLAETARMDATGFKSLIEGFQSI